MALLWNAITNSYVEFADGSMTAVDVTDQSYSFWIYSPEIPAATQCIFVMASAFTASNDLRTIFRKVIGVMGTGYYISGAIRFSVANGTMSQGLTEADITLNAWHHIGVTASRTSGAFNMWVDGVAQDLTSGVPSGTVQTGTDCMRIGTNAAGGQDMNSGRHADIAMWNTTLTEAQFQELARGVHPYTIAKSNLKMLVPLYGNNTDSPDFEQNILGTVNGTLTHTSHPEIMGPPRHRRMVA